MLLSDYVTEYALATDIAPSTESQYRHVTSAFERWYGRGFPLAQFSARTLNLYLLYLREHGRSPFTARNRRSHLLVLWRAAHRDGLAPPVEAVRPVRCPDPQKHTWTPDQVAQLVKACDSLSGHVRHCGLPRRDYYRTMILVGYETGLRRGDIYQLTRTVVSSGVFAVCQRKTRRQLVVRLTDATTQEVLAFAGQRSVIWPAPSIRSGSFARSFQQIVSQAGLQGTFGTLRKSSGTEVERQQPGAGWLHLGHTSPDTARRWYLDPTRAYDIDRPFPRLD